MHTSYVLLVLIASLLSNIGPIPVKASTSDTGCKVKVIRDTEVTIMTHTTRKNPRVRKRAVKRGETFEVYERPQSITGPPPYTYSLTTATHITIPGEDIQSIDKDCTLYRNQ